MEEHAGTFMEIFGVLFPDGYDYDAGFIANIDKSKESDGKIFFKNLRIDPELRIELKISLKVVFFSGSLQNILVAVMNFSGQTTQKL